MLQRNRAVAGFDRTHNAQFYGNYELPFGKGKSLATTGVASALLGGWQINWIMSRTSGLPFTITAAGHFVECAGQHADG